MEEPDAPVFVIDLGPETDGAPADASASASAEAPIGLVAIVSRDGTIALHRIPPTSDLRFLDALARLVRFADAQGRSVRAVAERYGSRYERELLFSRRIPGALLDWGRVADRD